MSSRRRASTDRSNGPTVRELETLRTMIETRKLIAAAAQLGVTQSAVSRAIGSLERKLGLALFEHQSGRLVPTSHAFALNGAADPVFAGLTKIARWPDIAASRENLRVATSPSFAQYLFPRLIARFRRRMPESVVTVEILTGAQVVSAVAEGRMELGVVDASVVHPGVKASTFRQSRLHALMLPDHPLARGGDITPRQLSGQDLIVQSRRFAARAELERAFQRAGVAPNIVSEAVTAGFAAELMLRGVGIAMVSPYPMSLELGSRFVARRFVPAIHQRAAMIFPAAGQVSDAARQFAEMVRDEHPDDPHSSAAA